MTEIGAAIAELRSEFRELLEAQSELLKTAGIGRHEKALLKIESIEKAYQTFKEDLERVPTQLDRETSRLTSLFDERFKGVERAFVASKELTTAYTAANAAAVAKSETATTKEIDGLKTLIESQGKGFDTEVKNLTDRLNRGEGALMGGRGVIGLIIGGIGAAGVLVAIFFNLHATTPTVGADTKRVDDLIAVITEQNRQVGQRMDALSARINALTPPAAVTPTPR